MIREGRVRGRVSAPPIGQGLAEDPARSLPRFACGCCACTACCRCCACCQSPPSACCRGCDGDGV